MTIGKAIRDLRKALNNISQGAFAVSLKIGSKTLQNYEQDLRVPPVKTLLWLAAAADGVPDGDLADRLYARFLGLEFMGQLEAPSGWELEILFKRSAPPVIVPPGTVSVVMNRSLAKRKR